MVKWNPLTEEFEIDFAQRKSDTVIGYAGYFELLNGFRKAVYWSREEIIAHRKRFSKTKSGGVWDSDFDAMARKTVVRNLLSKWGILSIAMQTAVSADERLDNDEAQEPVLVNPDTGEVIDINVDDLLTQEVTLDELE